MKTKKNMSTTNIAKLIRDGFVKTHGHKAKPGEVEALEKDCHSSFEHLLFPNAALFQVKFGGIEGIANGTYQVMVART